GLRAEQLASDDTPRVSSFGSCNEGCRGPLRRLTASALNRGAATFPARREDLQRPDRVFGAAMSLKEIQCRFVRGVVLFGVSAALSVTGGCASVKPQAGGTAGDGIGGGTGVGTDAGSSGGTGGSSTGPVVRLDAGMPPGCGDGQRTRDEACDDGNNVSGDGC